MDKDLKFDSFNNFIDESHQDLCTYESIFKNQSFIETYIDNVQKNSENIKKICIHLTEIQCYQEFLDIGFRYLNQKIKEFNERVDNFEKNYKGPEYYTNKDVAREELYKLFVCIQTKIMNVEELIEQINSSIKLIQEKPTEKIINVLVKHLKLLEAIDEKNYQLKDEVQKIISLQMIVMKKFNLKLKIC